MEKSFYIGEEENLKPKPYGKKVEYIPGDETELIPDPDTAQNMPGVDFEEWPEDPSKDEDGDITPRNSPNEYMAKSWQLDSYKTRAEEEKLVRKAVYGNEENQNIKKQKEKIVKKITEDIRNLNYEASAEPAEFSLEQATEPIEARGDISVSKKRESMNERIRPNKSYANKEQPYQSKDIGKSAKDNLKTMPEVKKQRTFRDRIRKFLDFS